MVNALWCGYTYKKLGNKEKAKQWFKLAATMQQLSQSDKIAAREANTLVSRL